LGWPIFRSYVSLREGISLLDPEFQPNILPEKILTNYSTWRFRILSNWLYVGS